MIKQFLQDLDKKWKALGNEPILLSIIGSTALFLQTDYERGTKDTDFLEIEKISETISKDLLKLGGEDSPLHKKHRLYLQIIKRPIPFLPPTPNFISLDSLSLKNFKVQILDVIDVVVSKLKPFRVQDLDDIRAMVNRHLVDPDRLIDRFLLAKERWLTDARAPELRSYIENLHKVQRELLVIPETTIELPDWLEDV